MLPAKKATALGATVLAAALMTTGCWLPGNPGRHGGQPAPNVNGDLPYATTGWPTLHGNAGNRKYQPVALATNYASWEALRGSSAITAPSTGMHNELYATTGHGEGASNLHAYDSDGHLLWESTPWHGKTGVDACAVLSTPLVDRQGDVYVSDCDQMWAFTSHGRVKWVSDLPPMPANSPWAGNPLHPNSFITAAFTKDGSVMGVTMFGQVVAFDRHTGRLSAPITTLPSVPAPTASIPTPASLYSGNEADPELKDVVWQVIFGGVVISANTPAVSATAGRIFVVASGADPAAGTLYGLDVTRRSGRHPGAVTIAFQTPVGAGSGCSPTLSPDNSRVYTCDNNGVLYAVDARTGQLVWKAVDAHSEAGSVAVGPDGTIYILVRGGTYAAYSPQGQRLWDTDPAALTAQRLPVNPTFGAPVAGGNGNPTVINGSLLGCLVYSYNVPVGANKTRVPIKSDLIEMDLKTGKVKRVVAHLDNPNEGIIAVRPDSTLVVSKADINASSVQPLAPIVNPLLTDGLKVFPSIGGFEVFRPVVR
jgi:outer membrane protein assembly factor BamB